MSRPITTFDRNGKKEIFDHPEQLVGKEFKRIEIARGDFTQDTIRSYFMPALANLGGELRQW